MSNLKLVIVGGVAGGATAAARARRLNENAEIVVFERGPYVSFANCGLPYHVGGEIVQRDKLLLQTPEGLKARYRIDARINTEVQSIDREKREVVVRELPSGRSYRESYDKLILSPGAAPIRPPLPGIDNERIFTLRTVPDVDRIKAAVDAGARRAIVVGGGFIGLEMAENLKRRGVDVDVVEMLDQVMPPIDPEMATPVHETLARNKVRLHLSDAVASFAPAADGITATLKSGAELTADLVVLAIGVRAESTLAKDSGLTLTDRGAIAVNDRMQTSDPDVFAVGDAVGVTDFVTGATTAIPLAGPANRQGRIAAENACGGASTYRGTQGTSVVRVFDLTVATTGANEKTLTAQETAFEKVYVHPAQHVGYFPGAAQMTIKLLFERPSGRVLGAQIVGGEGVDKRIDIVATAIQARMTVHDLEELELAYAPQYGAAKDPLNMAGFVAANVLRGDAKIVHANRLGEGLLLDVRSAAEHEAGAIPDSMLIPLPELRSRLTELPKDRPIDAYCQVGMRGYVAARILAAHGYEVRNVSGGYRTYCAFHPQPRQLDAGPSASTVSAGAGSCGCSSLPEGEDDMETEPVAPQDRASPDERLDVCGACCPGPIVAVAGAMKALATGKVLEVVADDPGFLGDIPAWCRGTGNQLLDTASTNGRVVARIRKGSLVTSTAATGPASAPPTKKTIVVFSGDLDRVLAALVIANGAVAMGHQVSLFFTFWGLNALRRAKSVPVSKGLIDRAFGWMMPRGITRLSLSKMHFGGMGTAMMKSVMQRKGVDSAADLLAHAQAAGVNIIACSMSLDVMGIKPEELIDGVEIGGVAAYLAEANESGTNLFV